MTQKSKEALSQQASLEYGDVLVSLWAAELPYPAEVKILGNKATIMIGDKDRPETGFFMLYDGEGQPLPLNRVGLSGWQLVVFVPEADDPDGRYDEGFLLYSTDSTDVDEMLSHVIPTVKTVSAAMNR